MKKISLAAFALLLLSFTSHIQQDNFKPLTQLAGGTWKMKTAKGYTCEQWTQLSNTELVGKGFRVAGKDTTVEENVQLIIKGFDVFYIPTVKGQNDGKPIAFKLTTVNRNTYQFSNPTHDFPQIVAYQLVNKDSINAWIEGDIKGTKRHIDFHYKRLN